MFNYRKIKKKISRVKSKFDKDQRNLHQIEISKEFLEKNFIFNKIKRRISDKGVERIFKFARHLKNNSFHGKKKDMWNLIVNSSVHLELFESCLKSDKKLFLELINNAGKTNLVYGYLNRFSYKDLKLNNSFRFKESMHVIDNAISLSEFRKSIKVYCPEQGGWVVENVDYKNLIKKNFLFKGKKIKPFLSPNFAYGIKIKNNFYGVKDLNGIYSAIKVYNIIKNYKIKTVNEIGAGLGSVAYYTSKLNKIQYNIYDLPVINLLQAYYLMLSIGENNVSLLGEKNKRKNCVKIMPYWEIFKLKRKNKALWFNQDSLPEIDKSLSEKYIKTIMSNKKNIFFQ